jgi:hypothetical protein
MLREGQPNNTTGSIRSFVLDFNINDKFYCNKQRTRSTTFLLCATFSYFGGIYWRVHENQVLPPPSKGKESASQN